MELQTTENNQTRIMPQFIRNGVSGNVQVLFEMIRITRKSVHRDLALKTLAADILLYNDLDSTKDTQRIFETLFNFVAKQDSVTIGYGANKQPLRNVRDNNSKRYVAFIQDIAGDVENIADARRTLSDGFGDCDNHAILNASLLGCLGYENVKFAMAKYDANAESFSHIYCVVYENGKRYVFDTTLPEPRLNAEIKAVEVKEIPVFEKIQGFDGLSGFLFNTKYQAKKFGRVATEIIPQVAAFLPLGFLSSNALATSAQLVSTGGIKELSFNAAASRINDKLDEIIVDLVRSRIAYDLAKSYALQMSVQINTISIGNLTTKQVAQIKESIAYRLNFIAAFPAFAEKHNIALVHLNAQLILVSFLSISALSVFTMYKFYRGNKSYA